MPHSFFVGVESYPACFPTIAKMQKPPSWRRSAAAVAAMKFLANDTAFTMRRGAMFIPPPPPLTRLRGIHRFDFQIATQVDNLLVISTATDSLAVVVADLRSIYAKSPTTNDSKHARYGATLKSKYGRDGTSTIIDSL
jgi:hypothetical protein